MCVRLKRREVEREAASIEYGEREVTEPRGGVRAGCGTVSHDQSAIAAATASQRVEASSVAELQVRHVLFGGLSH